MTGTPSVETGRRDSRKSETIAVPIPAPVFAAGRLEPGGCRICAAGPVLRVGGDGITIAFCALHAGAVWQQLTGAIESGVAVRPAPPEQRQPAAGTRSDHESEPDVAAGHEHASCPGRNDPTVELLENVTVRPTIHFSGRWRRDGKAVTRCGEAVPHREATLDPDETTCESCLRRLARDDAKAGRPSRTSSGKIS